VVPLVKAVQELDKIQNAKFKIQNDEIAELKQENIELKERLSKLEAVINNQQLPSAAITNNQSVQISNGSSKTVLSQNIPNPFNHTTTINYTLPQQFSSAKIIITDKTGKVLKEVNLSNSGKGSLNVDASM